MLPQDLGTTKFLKGWRLWDGRYLVAHSLLRWMSSQSVLGLFWDLGYRDKVQPTLPRKTKVPELTLQITGGFQVMGDSKVGVSADHPLLS